MWQSSNACPHSRRVKNVLVHVNFPGHKVEYNYMNNSFDRILADEIIDKKIYFKYKNSSRKIEFKKKTKFWYDLGVQWEISFTRLSNFLISREISREIFQ